MTIKDLVTLACPQYTGRKITQGTQAPKNLDSYWEEGDRTYYHFVNLLSQSVYTLHSNHPVYEPGQVRRLENELPKQTAMVCHHVRGTTQSITVYLGTGNDVFPVLKP